jgi:hypothetical protein
MALAGARAIGDHRTASAASNGLAADTGRERPVRGDPHRPLDADGATHH